MRLSLPRFTVRRLMLIVVLTAECLALNPILGGWSDQRSQDFSATALYHEKIMSEHLGNARIIYRSNGSSIRQDLRPSAYHRAMAAKYRWAARNPWFPVWSDPPEPE
jgi:hypothetical protein